MSRNGPLRGALKKARKSYRFSNPRYVSELVDAVAATSKTKDRDVAAAVAVCSGLHARHATFGGGVVAALAESVVGGTDAADDVAGGDREKRRRAALKLLLELFFAGVYDDEALLNRLLRYCVGVGPKGKRRRPVDAPLLAAFLKGGGEDLLGKRRRSFAAVVAAAGLDAAPARAAACSRECSSALAALADDGFAFLCASLVEDHVALRALEHRCTKDALTHGSLTEEKERALEEGRRARERLLKHVTECADCLDADVPALPEVEAEKEAEEGSLSLFGGFALNSDAGPFEDEAARAFYAASESIELVFHAS